MKWILITGIALVAGCSRNPESSRKTNSTDSPAVSIQSNEYDSIFHLTCDHQNLSKAFGIKVDYILFTNKREHYDSSIASLIITDKISGRIMDTLTLTFNTLLGSAFENCTFIRSYVTMINTDTPALDGNFGDIVIADLNFDRKDDIAIICDQMSSSGAFYSFYLQQQNGTFKPDSFLTDSMMHFPDKINRQNKTLVAYGIGGPCHVGEHVYVLNKTTQRWRQKSYRLIDICK